MSRQQKPSRQVSVDEQILSRHTDNTLRPTRPWTNAHHARLTSPSNTATSVWPWRTRYLTGRS